MIQLWQATLAEAHPSQHWSHSCKSSRTMAQCLMTCCCSFRTQCSWLNRTLRSHPMQRLPMGSLLISTTSPATVSRTRLPVCSCDCLLRFCVRFSMTKTTPQPTSSCWSSFRSLSLWAKVFSVTMQPVVWLSSTTWSSPWCKFPLKARQT